MTKEEIIKKAYVERDVSWMYFNHRILQEAKKEFVPLLERLSFLGCCVPTVRAGTILCSSASRMQRAIIPLPPKRAAPGIRKPLPP